jgi:hypothetical protein
VTYRHASLYGILRRALSVWHNIGRRRSTKCQECEDCELHTEENIGCLEINLNERMICLQNECGNMKLVKRRYENE